MKINYSKTVLASLLLGAFAQQASATLTFDLRATAIDGVAIPAGPAQKSPTVVVGQLVTLDVYAVVTGAAGNAATEGFQSFLSGDILTQTGGSAFANMQNPTLIPGFDVGTVSVGTLADLDADGDIDLGSNNTTFVQGQHTTVRASAVVIGNPDGVTPSEFRIFTVSLAVTSVNNQAGAPLSFQFRLTNMTSPTAFEAIWREDGVAKQTNNPTTGVSYGAPVTSMVIPVPEPTAFGMVLMGALGLVGFRRVGLRRF